jgi:GntR family transcriptional regulator
VRSVRLSGSLDDFLATAGALALDVLSLGETEPTEEVAEALELSAGEPVVRLELVSSLSSGPVIYLEAFFPLSIGRAIRREDIVAGMPVVRVIERKLQIRVVRAHQLIQSDLASETAARSLGVPEGRPILRLRRVYYTAGDRPIEVGILRLHPERYQYEIEFRARPGHV